MFYILGDPSILLSILGVLISSLSILLAILFSKYKKPCYYMRSVVFDYKPLKEKVKKLELFYEKKPVEQLTITRIIFLNKGTEGISEDDILSDGSVKIGLLSPYEIYSYEILYNERKEKSKFDIDIDKVTKNILPITFEYLDPYQGAVIQILHNGDEQSLKIHGHLKGVRHIKKINEKKMPKSFLFYICLVSCTITILIELMYKCLSSIFHLNPTFNAILSIFSGVVLTFIVTLLYFTKIQDNHFFAFLFPDTIPSRYLRKLNQNWIIKED